MANINFIVKNDIELKGNLIFEGATKDAYETTLAITDPTADRTITFPDGSGTVALTSNITKSAVGLGNVENTALSTWAGSSSITTLGTIATGVWSGTAISTSKGGTGLTSIGTAGQVLKVNSGATGLEWGTGGGSSGSSVTISSTPPSSPTTDQIWQDLDNGRIFVWNGTFWIEVQQNGSLGLLRYLGGVSSAPSTSIDGSALQVGEVYFDTTYNVMKVYNGSSWQDAFTAGSLSVNKWVKVMSGGQTSLSGNDDNSVSLTYVAGIESVFLNGVKLIRGSDYIATNGTTITNLEAIPAGSVVEVISYSGFTVANTYTKTEVDNMLAKQAVRWTEVAPVGSSITTLTGTDDYANTLAYTPGTELVYVNGILIARGIDYTASNGTSVVLVTALVPGDIIEIIGNTAFSVANTYTKAEVDVKLNTLTSPTINGTTSAAGNINPSATNTYDLGTTSLRWRNIYTQDLHLSNGIGDYTVVEGEEDLFLVNNKSGKSFKFALIEVDPSQVPPKSESN